MDRLKPAEWPLLVRNKIFDFLDANDLIRCSQVSRAWHSFILECVGFASLSCKEKVGWFHKMRYSFNFESIESDRFLFADDLKFLQSESLQTMLQKTLKRLFIHHPVACIVQKKKSPGLSFVQALNQFTKLEQLQVNALEVCRSSTEELILPNLVYLSISNFSGFGRLKLSTPKLTSFSTGDFDPNKFTKSGKLSNFKFEYPSRIVCLNVEEYETDLTHFVNLEILYCRCFDQVLSTNDFLAALPKLKELHSGFVGAKLICQFLSSKCKLRRISFHFYYCGFRIDTINDLAEYFGIGEDLDERTWDDLQWCTNSFETMLSNPHKVSQHIPFVSQILFYEDMVQLFDRISFASFFSKVVKLEEVEINRPKDRPYDESKLVEFLKACKFIGDLSTEESSLSQSLFDQLPVYQPYITELTIYKEAELNLEFIFKFTYLRTFLTNQKVSISFVSRAFRELKLLHKVFVFSGDKRFEIGRESIIENYQKENILEYKGERPMLSFLEDLIHGLA